MSNTSEMLATARTLFEGGEFSLALAIYLKLAMNGDTESLVYIGRIALMQQLDAENLVCVKKVLKEYGSTADHRYFMGVIHERSGEYGEAADAYRQAASEGSIPACYQLALLLRRFPNLAVGKEDSMENWLLNAAAKGHIYARGLVAKLRITGDIPGWKAQGLWNLLQTVIAVFPIVLCGTNKTDPFADPRVWKIRL